MVERNYETLRGLIIKVGLASLFTAGLTAGIRKTIEIQEEKQAQIQQARQYSSSQKQQRLYQDKLNSTTGDPYEEN